MKLNITTVEWLIIIFCGGFIFVDFVDGFILEFLSPRKGVHVQEQIHERRNSRNYVPTKMSFLTNPQNFMPTKYNDFTV